MDNFSMDSFFKSDAFASLDGDNKSLLREFASKVSEKSQAEAMAAFIEYREKLNIDESAQRTLLEALKAGLAPENRKRLELMEIFMSRGRQ